MSVKNKKILVVGFARSGLSASNFLLERGARVTITDTKTEEELKDYIAQLTMPPTLSLGGHQIEEFLDADFIVLSPGVPSNLPELLKASERNIPIYSEVELAYRFLEGRIIGVTGSNGKTTTATLIGELFKKAGRECVVAGNIGSPLIQWTEASSALTETTFVVELSSFQLENIEKFKCDIALILNVSPDHQDRYDRFEDYVRAKEQIFLNQGDEDYAVINADNPFTMKMASRRPARVLLYSRKQDLKEGVFVRNGSIQVIWGGRSSVSCRSTRSGSGENITWRTCWQRQPPGTSPVWIRKSWLRPSAVLLASNTVWNGSVNSAASLSTTTPRQPTWIRLLGPYRPSLNL